MELRSALGRDLSLYTTDCIGVRFTYTYQTVSLFLGLENRSGGAIQTPPTCRRNNNLALLPGTNNDTSLTTHLLAVEGLFFLKEQGASFRPFLGLGYSISHLKENFSLGTAGGTQSSVSHSNLGALGSAGTTYKTAPTVKITGDTRFFAPMYTTDTAWSQCFRSGVENDENSNLFDSLDTKMNSSKLFQFDVGSQYVF